MNAFALPWQSSREAVPSSDIATRAVPTRQLRTAVAVPCNAGRFSTSSSLETVDGCEQCPLGFWCSLGTASPLVCPAGRYGATPGQETRDCTGDCSAGFYCPEGSTSGTQVACREALRTTQTRVLNVDAAISCQAQTLRSRTRPQRPADTTETKAAPIVKRANVATLARPLSMARKRAHSVPRITTGRRPTRRREIARAAVRSPACAAPSTPPPRHST
eukprot:6601862-Prymnesium_polylepis.1